LAKRNALKKILSSFLIYLFTIANSYSGWVGSIDERQYVTNWNEYPYNLTLQKKSPSGTCTAQYFMYNYIITAAHCVADGETGSYFIGSKGKFYANLYQKGNYSDTNGNRSHDWAVFRVDDPAFYAPAQPFELLKTTTLNRGNVQLAGFSHLRILADSELMVIRDVVTKMIEEQKYAEMEYTARAGTQNASTIRLVSYSDFVKDLDSRLAAQSPAIAPLFGDSNKLKVVHNCSTTSTVTIVGDDTFIEHNCDSSQGSSGGALAIRDGSKYKIVGLAAMADMILGTDSPIDSLYATRPENYYPENSLIMLEPTPELPKDDKDDDSWSDFSIPGAKPGDEKTGGGTGSDFSIPGAKPKGEKTGGGTGSDFSIPGAKPKGEKTGSDFSIPGAKPKGEKTGGGTGSDFSIPGAKPVQQASDSSSMQRSRR
jgi:hypothetical protein